MSSNQKLGWHSPFPLKSLLKHNYIICLCHFFKVEINQSVP